ncbi:acylphosphatase [Methanocalculus alkaliphilus]|uniref:acylphosphatase n=1 Tax=Methanocalculus alkaliphilus TaxID=768730 RepID=UPI0020A16DE0|nr:acylphosphatase [Methanocalculus alkaliphilus]MCP1716368.1 acylphosphatase [Methanocalculus alkaliphilus]
MVEKPLRYENPMLDMDPHTFSRYSIQVSGAVQRVGYRHIVQNIARKLKITGYIENLEGYDVHIIAEGRVSDLDAFIQAIRNVDYSVEVEEICTVKEDYKGEYSYFTVIRGSPEEELAERIDTIIAISSRMERKQDISLEKHDTSISLQEKTIGLQEKTIGLQIETLTEVKGMRSDLDNHLNKEISEMRMELKEIRTALINYGIMNAAKS